MPEDERLKFRQLAMYALDRAENLKQKENNLNSSIIDASGDANLNFSTISFPSIPLDGYFNFFMLIKII